MSACSRSSSRTRPVYILYIYTYIKKIRRPFNLTTKRQTYPTKYTTYCLEIVVHFFPLRMWHLRMSFSNLLSSPTIYHTTSVYDSLVVSSNSGKLQPHPNMCSRFGSLREIRRSGGVPSTAVFTLAAPKLIHHGPLATTVVQG